ncbi:MAG: acetoin utilization protein AcuC, partial [Deltaproteobacteria bacterium]|nr:acetoin utilization protein AcuC [Deltaproteobacteria bacterium]
MKTAFIYSEKFGSFHYGPSHPMRPVRLKLTYELMEELKLTKLPDSEIVPARQATEAEIELFHSREYVRVLKEANTGIIPVDGSVHGLGFGDNPVFNGVYEWSAWSTGASIQAAELVASGAARVAFNIAGGLHHAMPNRASGFCYINDAAVAIKRLLALGKRVA